MSLKKLGLTSLIVRMASSTHNPVVSQKKKMRQMAKSAIKSLGYEEKKRQTKEVTRQLLQNPLYLSAERISVYLHMKDWEIGTVEILENSFRSSKKCYVPQYFMHPEPIMNMVELYDMKDFENLPITKWHIKQPPAENRDREVTKNLDLVLVPGLAFTKDGKRLGRGMGFYDKYLSGLKNKPITIALAFDVQIHDDLPTEIDCDFNMDQVLYCGA